MPKPKAPQNARVELEKILLEREKLGLESSRHSLARERILVEREKIALQMDRARLKNFLKTAGR